MIAPYVTTLALDPSDTDRAIVLSPAEQADELIAFWRGLSPRDKRRYWDREATDDEREVIEAWHRDVVAIQVADLNSYRTSQERRSA